ncbi:MAG TPA: hypothetical protein VIG32_03485 [Candidatus Baltobacteraceae bacterium]
MRHTPGWSVLAANALELGALAFFARVTEPAVERPYRPISFVPPSQVPEFIAEVADRSAAYYTASDGTLWIAIGLYADGRARITDNLGRRFAGTLHDRRAEMVELGSGTASDLIARFGIDGTLRLEMHGGSYDGRVFMCEPLTV